METKLNRLRNNQRSLSVICDELTAEHVDICFLVDCTSSMSTYIDQVRQNVGTLVQNMRKKFASFSPRCAFVGYRDLCEDERDQVISTGFTEDMDTFRLLLGEIKAFGGGDECEDVFSGLLEVSQLDWSSESRVLFHICDAPCHGRRFHTRDCEDHFAETSHPLGLTLDSIMTRINALGLAYYFAEVNSTTRLMVDEFNKELRGEPIRVVRLDRVEDLAEHVAQSVVTVIHRSKTRAVLNDGRRVKQRVINARIPEWADLSVFKKYTAEYFTVRYLHRSSRENRYILTRRNLYNLNLPKKFLKIIIERWPLKLKLSL